jgi:hypothetical protein
MTKLTCPSSLRSKKRNLEGLENVSSHISCSGQCQYLSSQSRKLAPNSKSVRQMKLGRASKLASVFQKNESVKFALFASFKDERDFFSEQNQNSF